MPQTWAEAVEKKPARPRTAKLPIMEELNKSLRTTGKTASETTGATKIKLNTQEYKINKGGGRT